VDPILSKFRFCNVRREDDRVTIWVRENIRDSFAGHPLLWLMLCIARQVNWPDTLADLMISETWPSEASFTPPDMTRTLNRRKAQGSKVYTGAYMISAPAVKGSDKQAYIAETVIGDLWTRRTTFPAVGGRSLRGVHAWIRQTNGWGPFMAYQAVVDMRFTEILDHAPDISTWAAAGPGTLRGLNRVWGRPLATPVSQEQALDEMKLIFERVTQETGVILDFSDVPNILCETDKYLRVKLGQGTPRALYVPGRGA